MRVVGHDHILASDGLQRRHPVWRESLKGLQCGQNDLGCLRGCCPHLLEHVEVLKHDVGARFGTRITKLFVACDGLGHQPQEISASSS